MQDVPPQIRAQGDKEALLFILAIVVGALVMAGVTALISDRVLGETVGFFSMWMAMYPFSRRTWAAGLSFRRYLAVAVLGTAFGAALRIVLR